MDKIRLVWDFYGDEAKPIAEHHAIHLKEYAVKNKLALTDNGTIKINDSHFYAYLDVVADEMIPTRDALRPHRGLKVED